MRAVAILAAAAALAACADSPVMPANDLEPAFAATVFKSNVVQPFAQAAFVPCAADGAGEIVLVQGDLHILSHTTINERGGIQNKIHFQPQGATGTGLTTGDTYRATGVTQQTATQDFDGFPAEFTYVNNFRMIGPGPGNNLLVHVTSHITINANGELTAEVQNVSNECR